MSGRCSCLSCSRSCCLKMGDLLTFHATYMLWLTRYVYRMHESTFLFPPCWNLGLTQSATTKFLIIRIFVESAGPITHLCCLASLGWPLQQSLSESNVHLLQKSTMLDGLGRTRSWSSQCQKTIVETHTVLKHYAFPPSVHFESHQWQNKAWFQRSISARGLTSSSVFSQQP